MFNKTMAMVIAVMVTAAVVGGSVAITMRFQDMIATIVAGQQKLDQIVACTNNLKVMMDPKGH